MGYRVPYVQTINSFFCLFPAVVSAQLFRQGQKKTRRGVGMEPVSWLVPTHLAKVDEHHNSKVQLIYQHRDEEGNKNGLLLASTPSTASAQ